MDTKDAVITYAPNFKVGKNSSWNIGCYFDSSAAITLGDDVIIGPYCVFLTGCHKFDSLDIPIRQQDYFKKPITVGNDCWIGARVTVLAGVVIGKGCVIGAGAVVTNNIPDFSVAVGVPAKVIKSRISR